MTLARRGPFLSRVTQLSMSVSCWNDSLAVEGRAGGERGWIYASPLAEPDMQECEGVSWVAETVVGCRTPGSGVLDAGVAQW